MAVMVQRRPEIGQSRWLFPNQAITNSCAMNKIPSPERAAKWKVLCTLAVVLRSSERRSDLHGEAPGIRSRGCERARFSENPRKVLRGSLARAFPAVQLGARRFTVSLTKFVVHLLSSWAQVLWSFTAVLQFAQREALCTRYKVTFRGSTGR